MRLARPSILWRFIGRELLRLLLLTVGVVVCVLAFALAVKPLADGRLSALDALRFMSYASVPMLQYALPFAAGFAATLAYHRMGQDNELTACYAGGLSHRAMLLPAALAGIVLSGCMAMLTDQAMPRLLRNMQGMLASDVTRLMQSAVERRQAIRIDDRRLIYADDMQFLPLEPGSQADQHFVLTGVVAVELDRSGAVAWEASSRLAYVWLYRDSRRGPDGPAGAAPAAGAPTSTAVLLLRDSIGVKKDRGIVEDSESTLVYHLPRNFYDDPKFLTWADMDRALLRPEVMNYIDAQRATLATMLAERRAADTLRASLGSRGAVEFAGGGGRRVTVRGSGVEEQPTPKGFSVRGRNGNGVEVTVAEADGRTRVHRARRAFVSLPSTGDARRATGTMTIAMEEVATTGGGPEGDSGVLPEFEISGLVPSPDPLPALAGADLWSLLGMADQRLGAGQADRPLAEATARLRRQCDDLRREIFSKRHERIATSLSCLLMTLCGAVMAMRLRDSLPLTVYLWSFLPGLGAVLTINGGQKATYVYGPIGLVLLYGGLTALALYAFIEFRRLAKH
ncbi:MAG: LptF/LptG family permease [Phycisphaerae bacterium]|nr:LptF/LptG family permease [Phycisphaerae bacterium]